LPQTAATAAPADRTTASAAAALMRPSARIFSSSSLPPHGHGIPATRHRMRASFRPRARQIRHSPARFNRNTKIRCAIVNALGVTADEHRCRSTMPVVHGGAGDSLPSAGLGRPFGAAH
jgi:hypothetical protein